VTLFPTYVIQSVLCACLSDISKYANHPTAHELDESGIFAACFELMTFHFSDQPAYYQDVLVSLYTKQSKMKHPPLEVNHYHHTHNFEKTIPVLPMFCVENYYPYAVHVYIFCEHGPLYESAFGLVRKLCSGFQEHELTQAIGYQNFGFVNENSSIANAIYSFRSKIDVEIVPYDAIFSLYESIFIHMLYNNYRIIFYNRDYDHIHRNIDFLMYMGSPPCWNDHHNTPVEVFVDVLQNFRKEVHDSTTISHEMKDYINLLCQQVLLRIIYVRFKRCVKNIPNTSSYVRAKICFYCEWRNRKNNK
jgi:hypothetical protein